MDAPWNMVCFSGADWRSHRQRPHHVMTSFAERGAEVLFVDNLGTRLPRPSDARRVLRRLGGWARSSGSRAPRVGPRIRVDSPVVLPLQHLAPVRALGRRTLVRRVSRRIGPRRPLVVWTYLPMPVIADAARALGADALVYDWADDASEHVLSRSAGQRERIARWEEAMVAGADVVFVASEALLAARGSSNPRTFVIPHGAPRRGLRRSVPRELADLPHPMVGFVGSITQWTDLDLVDRLARERPAWQFVMVGPVKTRVGTLRRRRNVVLTGERPHEEIPAYLSAFDVAIIPYRVTPATTAASPVKLREYLSHGLPVVSVDVPEVRPFVPQVEVASDAAGFLAAIERALAAGRHGSPGGRSDTWDERVDEMIERVSEALGSRS